MQTLQRRLGLGGAAAIGVASMLGAGVFFVWAPATAAAGGAVLIALPVAAAIASLNAASTIRLAVRHPVSGGAYAYGRAELGEVPGFVAGCLFLLGKTASVAAIGLIAGGYLWPGSERLVAVGLIVVLAAINATGVRTTAVVSAIAAAVVVVVLVVLAGAGAGAGAGGGAAVGAAAIVWSPAGVDAITGVLSASGLIFFAFAGYARIATLGEEVRDPRRTLPRAAVLSIAVVLALCGLTLGVLLAVLGTTGLAASTSPLVQVAAPGWAPVVRGAVAIACIGSMTGVLAGLSRTAMAMSRDGELPGPLAKVSTRTATPIVADVVVAALAVVAVLLLDPARTIGLSACAVLGYYAIAHLAALRAGRDLGLARVIPILGLVGCLAVALSTPWPALLAVAVVVALAVAGRALVRRRRRA
ncbi:MAG: APC family permease [Pseudolysinimonas sp.]